MAIVQSAKSLFEGMFEDYRGEGDAKECDARLIHKSNIGGNPRLTFADFRYVRLAVKDRIMQVIDPMSVLQGLALVGGGIEVVENFEVNNLSGFDKHYPMFACYRWIGDLVPFDFANILPEGVVLAKSTVRYEGGWRDFAVVKSGSKNVPSFNDDDLSFETNYSNFDQFRVSGDGAVLNYVGYVNWRILNGLLCNAVQKVSPELLDAQIVVSSLSKLNVESIFESGNYVVDVSVLDAASGQYGYKLNRGNVNDGKVSVGTFGITNINF